MVVKHFFADGAYDRGELMDKAAFLDFTVKVIKRITGEPGFKVLPRRWAELPKVPRAQHVERQWRAWNAHSAGWSAGAASVRDYERRIDVSKRMIYVAMGSSLLSRIHL